MRDYGGTAQQFREVELTGTRLTSLIKAEIFMFPVVMIASFLFWSYIWGSGDPISSDAYPYAQKMWHRRALYQSLWISSTVTGQSPLFQAIDLNVILGGLGFGLGSFDLVAVQTAHHAPVRLHQRPRRFAARTDSGDGWGSGRALSLREAFRLAGVAPTNSGTGRRVCLRHGADRYDGCGDRAAATDGVDDTLVVGRR